MTKNLYRCRLDGDAAGATASCGGSARHVHEIKHDGYRLIVRRDGNRVRLYTRRGYNWSHRFPLIVQAVTRLKVRSVIIDGEAVVCDENGLSNFDKLHSQGYDNQVVLYAFDLIELEGPASYFPAQN
jgi:bifunctional non-homologous end joining protein LigD